MATYSFLNVAASITGPGGSFQMGSGAGSAEEGIEITHSDKNVQTIGADGKFQRRKMRCRLRMEAH